MGGFFGIASNKDCLADVYFGTDYHSHLGTYSGGLAVYDEQIGLQRQIHHIGNSPFRTKFEKVFDEMKGTSAIGVISDTNPQPLLVRSQLGTFAICTIGVITNVDEILEKYFSASGGHFNAMTGGKINGTELVAALISQKQNFVEGISYAQESIDGTCSLLLLKDDGTIIAARDKLGRIPIHIGSREDANAVSFESFALEKLGFTDIKNLGPGEIVEIKHDSVVTLKEPGKKKKVCSFLWSYYGYPTSSYEGKSVEIMRYKNGEIIARRDMALKIADSIDYVGGVPDSGTPHAIGYSNESHKPFARAFIKYTPTWARSFMPSSQVERNQIAKMKQIPVFELIRDKKLLFVDDSIVRGTQLRETVEFLYENGAKEVHMRSASPCIMYGCKYLNFSRQTKDTDLIARAVILELEGEEGFKYIKEYSDGNTERGKKLRQEICKKFRFDSLEFQTLDGLIEAIGLDKSELCTYCFDGED